MSEYLGLDTSNYTTSAAVYDTLSGAVRQRKLLLPVKIGERGLRQSDALFHHVRQLPDVAEELLRGSNIAAIGVSTRPRNVEGSYMPCFLMGKTAARLLSTAYSVPLYTTSHQVGHILAALYSSKKLELLRSDKPFLAFHVSGGTTDMLLCEPDEEEIVKCREIGSSLDLKAGQAIDRVGVMLGLSFPCGTELEKLALSSDRKFRIRPALKDMSCSLSGIENRCRDMYKSGESAADTALYCIRYIESSLEAMTEAALKKFGDMPIIYAGGVMSCKIIRSDFERKFGGSFAEPVYSSDNAAGIAIYAAIKDGKSEFNNNRNAAE